MLGLVFEAPLTYAQKNDGTITLSIEPEYNKVSGIHRVLLGENYRKLWALPVQLRVIHLGTEKGGLTVIQKGGGLQTRSLRLKDKNGQEWVLRSVQKYPERALPANLRPTIAKAILQDQISTSNPFAALTVPTLADALNVPHSNPEIVYVGDDPALGEFRKDYKNSIYLFEEREPLDSENTDNTKKVQKKLRDDNDVSVEQKMVLRARLLDMIIGDWDRHDDQWRWDKDKTKKQTIYTPIPRDRDQVYYKTSGVLPWIVAHQWLKTKFQPYSAEIRDIKTWNFNARYFDRYFLNDLDEKDWQEQIAYVQNHLTDDVIDKALHKMPANAYAITGEETKRIMIARRNNIGKQAIEYYHFLSRLVDVPASSKRERVDVDEQADGKVNVTIHKVKKDSTEAQVVYHRSFDPAYTKEVRIYGFGGNDAFNVSGTGKSPIKVRMIGGEDVDTFKVDKQVDNKSKLHVYDRSDQQNVFPEKSRAHIHTGEDTVVNYFDRKNFLYDRFQPIVYARYNNDYGVILTGGFAYTKNGFRKTPYEMRQELLVSYAFNRESFRINYRGDWIKLIGNNDLNIHFTSRGPHNMSNFFGVGNETSYSDKNNNIVFYRTRYDHVYGDARLSHQYDNWRLSGGVSGQFYYSGEQPNDNKFLRGYAAQNQARDIFSTKTYAGLVVGAELDTRNNPLTPSKGVYWNSTLNGVQQLNQNNMRYAQLESEFSFYINPDKDSVLVLAARFGGGTTFGDAEYFQQLKLGGSDNLRGYRTWRFTGKSMVYNNLEMRLKLFDFNSYLFPGSVGMTLFNDIGRVWVPNESSSRWHDGYGGGLYFVPAELVLIQGTFARSTEGHMVYVNIGYRF
ncbi:BamA/TamA family outer membrane protein [Mucilaginibacter lacusdianchii]|uniref:BamA/TamA family outer membrane protein n=1 Tax=Mucilaginibacter lacusdianchii TaxID=2684211 RepID=UPI001E491830|nr:BamA/TamA family outer membrane protein [Mucilaginibacter sp. JXJ CY 39]